MEKDLRLYYFDGGVLHKPTGKEHKPWKNIDDIKSFLKRRKENNVIRMEKSGWRAHLAAQYVIVEYMATYQAKIIEVINTDEI